MYDLWNEVSVSLSHYTCCVLHSLATIVLQPMLVSNSNISLKISTFALPDIVGHVAVRPAIYGVL